jgi:hypothetical protein
LWPYRHSGSGRREFRRVVLTSLLKSAQAELEERRTRGQHLRARRTLRRLEELEQQLAQLEALGAPLPRPWYAAASAEAATAVAGVVALAVLALLVAARGSEGVLVGAVDVLMLLATVTWFSVAVARHGRRRPSFEGSPGPEVGR